MGDNWIALSQKNQEALLLNVEEYIKDDRDHFEINPRIVAWMLDHIGHLQGEIEETVNDVKTMTVDDFQKQGYLQELNRFFLHPLGMAMSVRVNKDGEAYLFGPVYDIRDDPEGAYFGDLTESDVLRGERIVKEWSAKRATRVAKLGYMVQPLKANRSGDEYK